MEELITITKQEYDRLIDDSNFLNRLRAAGVDNWEGFGFACEDEEETEEDIYGKQ